MKIFHFILMFIVLFVAKSSAEFYGVNVSYPSVYYDFKKMSDDEQHFVFSDDLGNVTRYTDGIATEILTYVDHVGSISPDASTIVGRESDRMFRWENGNMNFFDNPSGVTSADAYCISHDKSIIGGSMTTGVRPDRRTEASIWYNNSYSNIGFLDQTHNFSMVTDLSADGSIAIGLSGYSYQVEGRIAFKYENGQMQSLGELSIGDVYIIPDAISADGSTIAGRSKSESGNKLFMWKDNEMTTIGTYLASNGIVKEVSPDGSFILGWTDDSGFFYWNETNGLRNFEDVLQIDYNLNLTGWDITNITGMTSDGTKIYGTGTGPNGENIWIAEIPEPTSVLIFGIGSLTLLIRRKQGN